VIHSRLGNRVVVDPPTGNVQLTVFFREKIDDVAVAHAMQDRGYSVCPLSNTYMGDESRAGLIIGFAGATDEQIDNGMEALGNLLEELEP
jgi:GntR family transcriptional regulator / MocR family aminotransferase